MAGSILNPPWTIILYVNDFLICVYIEGKGGKIQYGEYGAWRVRFQSVYTGRFFVCFSSP